MTAPPSKVTTPELKKFVHELRHALPENVSLILGGRRTQDLSVVSTQKGVTPTDSFVEFDRHLGKLRATSNFPY
jgi:hypothetical protein